ncbi:type VI secretion system baseplate subunit TssF [Aureimonas leprariae]|uniref:Type VI secretion system baseplate subunit TssF n=1 Tax=Plantimonas leprariae TaxID=2615207 RepID=A0A7V7PQ24_9HYPH|nr:type VI secretion system baseplate subunit TssF [Aureimonas leprariae]KAB0680238.1 type VI secretion system baseplate subunit TssF [Aureimonas leprariae]
MASVGGFLQRYSEELGSLRRRAARFAEANPKIAGRLRLSGDAADDPHVERIVQSFAYVAARVRTKLDDEFPELTSGMLEALYPHYLAPVPSMTVIRLDPPAGLDAVQRVPRGSSIAAEAVEGERCRFRTTQDVAVAPVRIEAATLASRPVEAPPASLCPDPAAVLRLAVRPLDATKPAGKVGIRSLRFFVAAPWREATAIHELILNHTKAIALARHAGDAEATILPPSRLKPVGFEDAEGMLPYPPSSFVGYRLLTEFFALPQKFLFFEIDGLESWDSSRLEIFLYFDEARTDLERAVGPRTFVLGATPAVNLFPQRAEPIAVDGTRTDYPLVPDARRHATREVYGVTSVTVTDGRNGGPARRFFEEGGAGGAPAWHLRRTTDPADGTGEVSIGFAERTGGLEPGPDLVAGVETLSFNRDLPERLPYGGGHPRLELVDDAAGLASVEAIGAMTPVLRIEDDDERRWRLVSHLNLNHLSLADGTGAALKSLLRLYAIGDRRESGLLIDAISGLRSAPATARLHGGGMVAGTDLTLVFDPAQIDRGAAYLFGSVLDRFFGLYASMNSFTRLTAEFRGRDGIIAAWPARAGARPLL